MTVVTGGDVAAKVVAWQEQHGRNHLPWQQMRDPYRVWLSEIMLQQTQVATVLDYYARFLARFPDVAALAAADQDAVMGLWSGLGYYSRARNLHKCARAVVEQHGGAFPQTAELLMTLPGIGRSTAGAIAAFCFSERTAILDANVRRVLTRLLAFGNDLAVSRNENLLWDRATELLPSTDLTLTMPRYTQGLMDLGATICTPKAPRCDRCPLADTCSAFAQRNPEKYPVKTRKLIRRAESWWLLVLLSADTRVWLERRPPSGIWAGMHCVPVFPGRQQLDEFLAPLAAGVADVRTWELPASLHILTHRDLHLHAVVASGDLAVTNGAEGAWFGEAQWSGIGLPAPIRKLLYDTRQQGLL
ncbi:A/G-specific adenine glycosylase [Acidovorax sp. BL-A-41-H1]|uniref:A/G-specific adenine glycosylase n=1 Tax=Acidovorax sp. BL-A-41-H1 TaxID=3421102 RepID=UPI003F79059A